MNETTIQLLTKMCEYVNVEYKTIDFKSEYWYMKHGWTESQQEEFIQYIIEYIKTNKKAFKDLTGYSYKNKALIEYIATYFTMNYGWKTKQEIKLENIN